jgi:two-component system chemotaxis response regulator CheY
MIRTLHLDDSTMALKMIERILRDICTVDCFADIGKASSAIREKQYELILTDYSLCGGTGFNFVERVRRTKGYEKTPIILLAASLSSSLAFKAMKVGINESFSKMIPARELKAALLRQVESPYIKNVDLFNTHLTWVYLFPETPGKRHTKICPANSRDTS